MFLMEGQKILNADQAINSDKDVEQPRHLFFSGVTTYLPAVMFLGRIYPNELKTCPHNLHMNDGSNFIHDF